MADEDDSDDSSGSGAPVTQGDFLDGYRNHLILAEQKAQQDYDKTVLTLSGGAIAISFTFLKDILGGATLKTALYSKLLVGSWLCWGTSVTCVLLSFYLGQCSLRHAIEQIDRKMLYMEKPGGFYASATKVLNLTGGILFVIGLLLLGVFVKLNS